jgi:hypothetical protein
MRAKSDPIKPAKSIKYIISDKFYYLLFNIGALGRAGGKGGMTKTSIKSEDKDIC